MKVKRLCLLLCVSAVSVMALCGGAVRAWAAPAATTTTMAVTSGGSAVTMVTSGSVVTLTATVTAGSTAVTVGQVNFCDATAKFCTDIHLLDTAQLTKAGTATYKFRPGVGSHSYKAVFAGTTNNTTSTSGTVTLAVTGLSPTITTIAQSGSVGNYTLTATVGGTGSTAPTGTVSFLNASNGNAVLGTAALTTGTAGLSFLNSSSFSEAVYGSGLIAVGDFNGDGIPDIAVVNSSGCMTGHCWDAGATVFLGDGHGNFTAATTLDLGKMGVTYIAAGDFNEDGILDLAVGSSSTETVTTLLGKGDGTFSAGGSVATGGAFSSFAVADFNGDGIPDLAVLNTTADMVTLLLGNGDGTFTPSSAATSATGSSPMSITVGDFNGDGIPDLAIANYNYNAGTLTILLGKGDGTFTTAASPATGSGPDSIAVGDFNGDGILDLAVPNYYDGTVTILLGNGNGTFTPSSDSPVTLWAVGHNEGATSIAVGDFNGDGTADLAINSEFGITPVLLGNGDGTFSIAQPSGNNSFLAMGDFNGDGRTDLVGSGTVLLTATETSTATANGIAVPVATVTQQVLASYAGDSDYETSASGTIILTAAQGTPIVNLTASPNPATTSSSVTLTATVNGTGLTPTGTVTFYAGSRLLGTAALNSSGVAAYTTSSLAAGNYSLTASYGGDSNYFTANSSTVALSVSGTLTPTVTVTPSSSSVTTAQALTVTVTVNGGSGNKTPTGSVTLASGGYTSSATTLSGGSATINVPAGSLASGSDTLTASYTPDSSSFSTYSSATGTSSAVTVTQAKTTPTITWATPAAIIYGTALSATQFNATSTVAGTFAYTPAAGAVLPAGTQTLSVTFTPTDSADYTTATQTVSLTVNKAPLSVTANNQSMTYGGTVPTLTGTLSGVMAGDGITAAYTTTGTSASAAGSYPITATLNDPNTKLSNYTVTNTSGLLTIGAATPTITWATPAAITYGTALSAAQLDATASVPGTFAYIPAAGTVPAAGNDTLSVTFTPTNTTDYTTATAVVTLTVNIPPNNPVPVIGGLSPTFTSAGGAAFTLTVNGTGFITGSTVYWGTSALTTTYVSATQLTAAVTAAEITSAGITQITVQAPAPGGGTSNALQFEVDSTGSGSTAPTLTAVTATVTAGSPASYTVTLPSTVENATVSCLNLPTGAACSYASGTVTITTSSSTPKGMYPITVIFTETVSGVASSWILLPILLLPLVFLRKRLLARGAWVTACLGLILLAATAFSVIGCGGGGGSSSTPPPQTHQVVSSGTVSLTVQ